ncbi:MAG TPA: hypothetical protein VI322_05205 [Candidatus Saccharimonadia bacterium]
MIDPAYFERKRQELGMDRQDTLEFAQSVLDSWYPGRARAKQLHQGVLRIVTPSASVAGELRLRQLELLETLEGRVEAGTRLSVTIG